MIVGVILINILATTDSMPGSRNSKSQWINSCAPLQSGHTVHRVHISLQFKRLLGARVVTHHYSMQRVSFG
ncbi:hypothetical protein GGS21DRAFT_296252 [Xylaria nigripes]|nr:hypothetical protein GGS21DRAFT_296252 [Xylaria nigripes]